MTPPSILIRPHYRYSCTIDTPPSIVVRAFLSLLCRITTPLSLAVPSYYRCSCTNYDPSLHSRARSQSLFLENYYSPLHTIAVPLLLSTALVEIAAAPSTAVRSSYRRTCSIVTPRFVKARRYRQYPCRTATALSIHS